MTSFLMLCFRDYFRFPFILVENVFFQVVLQSSLKTKATITFEKTFVSAGIYVLHGVFPSIITLGGIGYNPE